MDSLPATPITTDVDNNISAFSKHPMYTTHRRVPLYDISKLLSSGCTIIEGRVYNDKGHNICGVLNQHDKPCRRIGNCPFHTLPSAVTAANSCNGYVDPRGNAHTSPLNNASEKSNAEERDYISRSSTVAGTTNDCKECPLGGHPLPESSTPAPMAPNGFGNSTMGDGIFEVSDGSNVTRSRPPRKMQYKHGWSKCEHYLFLRGLQKYNRGSWKQIASFVKTRTPTQVQSHAQKYFLRQRQNYKNKRSIHDLTIDSPEMQKVAQHFQANQSSPHTDYAHHALFESNRSAFLSQHKEGPSEFHTDRDCQNSGEANYESSTSNVTWNHRMGEMFTGGVLRCGDSGITLQGSNVVLGNRFRREQDHAGLSSRRMEQGTHRTQWNVEHARCPQQTSVPGSTRYSEDTEAQHSGTLSSNINFHEEWNNSNFRHGIMVSHGIRISHGAQDLVSSHPGFASGHGMMREHDGHDDHDMIQAGSIRRARAGNM